MAGILFLLDALAFVLVLQWIFARRASTEADAETGLFAMRSAEGDAPSAPEAPVAASRRGRKSAPDRRAPSWKRLRPRS